MTSTNRNTLSPIRQSIDDLKGLADALHYGEVDPRWQVEKVALYLASALTSIDDRLTALEQYDANRIYVARLEEELAQSQKFPDLASLVNARCTCGREHEVIPVAGSHFARCVSPACEGHGKLIPLSRKLAEAWEDLAQGEDMSYAEGEEDEMEASNG